MKADVESPVAPVLVLGIGNVLLADDGVGLAMLERLRRSCASDPRVEFLDGGTQGVLLVGRLEGRRALLLLDAVRRGAKPGRVHVLRHPERVVARRGLDAHGSNASELLASARLAGALPKRVRLVGVEPAEVHTRLGLSSTVSRALPDAVEAARVQLAFLLADVPAEGGARCTS